MNNLFIERANRYFGKDSKKYLELLKQPCSQGLFLNTNKADRNDILDIIDFEIEKSDLTDKSYYHHEDNIGKTKAYELGLIYPQEIAASLSTSFIDPRNVKVIVDMCAAPGGKTINALNQLDKDVICICNDVNYKRAQTLSQNLERLGLDNVIIANKQCDTLSSQLEACADLVILDAPCSGEGMIRKYPEILDEYSVNNINNLAQIQKGLLEDAYRILKGNGQLVYSTCTYAFEEDENQITDFLNCHPDMHMIDLKNEYSSTLKGTIKLSPLYNTEGQFICMMVKDGGESNNLKYLKTVKEKIIDDFIKDNLDIDEYYLYKHNDYYYLSTMPLYDLGNNVLKYGIQIGQIVNKRFEPSHNLYRANSLRYKYVYDLNDEEYDKYVSGNELVIDREDNYYLLTYHGYSLGFGKLSKKHLKNKYPKGLRRML